jgi:hypothetical protein
MQLQEPRVDGPRFGTTLEPQFCASCTFSGSAMTPAALCLVILEEAELWCKAGLSSLASLLSVL